MSGRSCSCRHPFGFGDGGIDLSQPLVESCVYSAAHAFRALHHFDDDLCSQQRLVHVRRGSDQAGVGSVDMLGTVHPHSEDCAIRHHGSVWSKDGLIAAFSVSLPRSRRECWFAHAALSLVAISICMSRSWQSRRYKKALTMAAGVGTRPHLMSSWI